MLNIREVYFKPRTRESYTVFWLLLSRVFFIVCIAIGFSHLPESSLADSEKLNEWLDFIHPQESFSALIIWGGIYAILLSMPFVPGLELGLLLMFLSGKEGIPIIYLYTILGLSVSFGIGRRLPKHKIVSWLNKNRIPISGSDGSENIVNLFTRSPWSLKVGEGLKSHLPRSRYVVIGLLLNLPGNSFLGGGGGIAMVSGMSRQITWKGFLFTVAAAVSPIPLLVLTDLTPLELFL